MKCLTVPRQGSSTVSLQLCAAVAWDSAVAGTGDRPPQPRDRHSQPGAAEPMQNSSAKLINSNNSPPTQQNPYHHWWALHPTTCCSESVPVTLLILIFVRSLGQHYLEQNSLKLKTKQDLKSEQTSCVICLQPGDLNSLKKPLEGRDPCPGITLWIAVLKLLLWHYFPTRNSTQLLLQVSACWIDRLEYFGALYGCI